MRDSFTRFIVPIGVIVMLVLIGGGSTAVACSPQVTNTAETANTVQMNSLGYGCLSYDDATGLVYRLVSTGGTMNGAVPLYYHNYVIYYSKSEGFYYYDSNDVKQSVPDSYIQN